MTTFVADKDLQHTVYLAERVGAAETADQLNLSKSAVNRRLQRAASRGLFPRKAWAPAVPPGFLLHGVSTHLDASGEVTGQWFKASRDRENFDLALEVIDEALGAHSGKAEPTPKPTYITPSENLLTTYVLGDHHFGMYVWAKECGASYDADLAWKILESTMRDLVLYSPHSHTAIVLNLGDFFHAENDNARTPKSGNVLDTDTRFARVLLMGVDLTILTIQLALQNHTKVIYRALPGNHDPYASIALAVGVAKFFERDERVEVDLDPSYFFVYEFGKTMIAAAHGDTMPPAKFISLMAAKWPEIWGRTRYRYAMLGHVHHKSKSSDEEGGAVWETFQCLAPKDSFHSTHGYISHRNMTAITHHRDSGERFRTVRNIDWR